MDFLDKMKDGITKGIDTVSAKGKGLMEDAQAFALFRKEAEFKADKA